MTRGPLPLQAHAAMEPPIGILIIAAPWIFGFSDGEEARTICIVVGAAILATGAMTQWRFSLVKLIPLRVHFIVDFALAAALVLSPFLLGFSDEGGATRFMVVVGAIGMLTAVSTRWDPQEAGLTGRDSDRAATI